jgi:hypothetical protein
MNHQTDRNRPRSGRHTITLRAAVERRRPAGRTAAGRLTAGRYQWQSPTPGASPMLGLQGVSQGLDEATIDGEVSAGDIASPVAS